MKHICVLIPCYNEEKGLGSVLNNIPKNKLKALGYKTTIIVIDNNSTDNTKKIAKSKNVKVITEKRQGKGNAIISGFNSIPKDTSVVVMLDGDNTYKSHEILRLIEPIDSGFCDVVIGTRLNGKMIKNSMPYFNRVGNWFFTFLVRIAYHGNVTDVCTGFFAWKVDVIRNIRDSLTSKGFSIEMEMIAKIARLGYGIYSVPITYAPSQKSSSLNPIKDGFVILNTWAKYLFWNKKITRGQ